MVTLAKSSGAVGLPSNMKEAGRRVDFRPDDFTLLIETKGYRLAWSRAAYCPCVGVNDQTDQPDPNCELCAGKGWLLFRPYLAATPQVAGDLNATQKLILGANASVIKGVMSSFFSKENPYEAALRRVEGKVNLTVRPENKLGYYDRLVNLDATMVFTELLTTDGSGLLTTRFPVVGVNLLRTQTKAYVENVDFNVVGGKIYWLDDPNPEPPAGLRVVAHYLTYPHWRVMEHPHITRATLLKFKNPKPVTPAGDPTDLPLQAVCQLEFLI